MHHKPHNTERGRGKSPLFKRVGLLAALAMTIATTPAATFVSGYLNYEYYPGVDRLAVEAGGLTPAAGGTIVGSDKGGLIPSFEAGNNFAEGYANRVFGYFIPPVDGDYVFYIAADDDSDLFLSTDADPANKKLIAQEAGWSGIRNYSLVGGTSTATDKKSNTFIGSTWDDGSMGDGNTVIHLLAGQKYYIESIHHEGGGGDNLAVTYRLASEPPPANGSPSRLSGAVIGADSDTAPTAGTVTITTQPASTTKNAGDAGFSLSVAATTTSPYGIGYQWFKDGVAIPGATANSYSINGPLYAGQSGSFTVKLSVPNADGTPNTVTSSAAVVTINAGPAPTLVTGALKYEYFPGKNRGAVEGGTAGAPSYAGTTVGNDKSGAVSIFESGTNFADTYANRFSGVFIPPTTDNYVFLVASDDDGDLFLSTDENPANKKLIAQEPGWSGVRNYSQIGGGTPVEAKTSSSFAGSQWADFDNDPLNGTQIHLEAGKKYYIEYVHAEGGGGDNVAVTYRTETEDPALTDNRQAPRLTGAVIGTYVVSQNINISGQPANTTVYAGTPATFTVAATTDGFYPVTYKWFRNGVEIPNVTGPSYSLVATPADSGAKFKAELTYYGNTAPVQTSEATLTVNPEAQSIIVQGGLKDELFFGATRTGLEAGDVGKASNVKILSSLEAPTNIAEGYSQRVSGWFTPDTTGDYVFFIAADDDSDLFLSTDATAAHKVLIAQENGWSGVRRYYTVGGAPDTAVAAAQKRSDTFSPDGGATTPFSAGIHLVQGTKYYIEAVHHEGGGGDNLAVTFKLIGDTDPVEADPANAIEGDPSKLTGPLISYETSPVTGTTITTQPANISTYEAQAATFSVAVNTDSEVTPLYQWRKNGTPIPGATASSYNIGFLAVNDSGNYDVVITTPNLAGAGSTITSTAASLQVLPAPLIRGLLKYDYFPNQTRTSVEAGTAGNPQTTGNIVGGDKSGFATIAESERDFADNYANRFSGYFIPPVTDNYVFFVNGDDDCDLFLSTDDTPANKKLIAQEASWSNYRSWNAAGGGTSTVENKRSDSFANSQWTDFDPNDVGMTIHLEANKLYYIEGVHHEGGGGDNFGITFKLASELDPINNRASSLIGDVIGVKLIPTVGTTPPTVTSAVATTNGVVLTFSAPIDTSTLVNGNFNLGAGVTINSIKSKEVLEGSKVVALVTLNTSGLNAGQKYTVTINNVKDTKGNVIAANTKVDVTTPTITLTFNDPTTPLPDGVTAGNNGTPGAGEVIPDIGPDGSPAFQLTDAANGQQGALIIQNPVTDPVSTFTATFKLFIGLGTGNPADGMSFNFGNIDPAITSVGEEGVGAISVNFDTYNNGNSGPNGLREAPAFEVKLNGSIVGWAPLPQAGLVNELWVDVVISLNNDNSITTVYNGVTYFNHLSLNNPKDLVSGATIASYTPVTGGEFMIGGRTGNENTRQALDDLTLSINTGGTPIGGKPTITVAQNGANLTISWDNQAAGQVLQGTPALGPNTTWTTVASQSPATVPIGAGIMFFRVQGP
jgi:hypothetical protein